VDDQAASKGEKRRNMSMKKLSGLVLAMLMALGVSSVASAQSILSFDIDFGQDGIMDTGTDYKLLPGQTVNADIYFSVIGAPIVGGGYDLRFDQSKLSAEFIWFVPDFLLFEPPMQDTGLSRTEPGHVFAEAFVTPPGTSSFGGKFGSITFTWESDGPIELWLYDFDERSQWVTIDDDVLDCQLADGIRLGSVNIPIPGAVWLLGSGLFGLVGIGFRRKKRS
jgi:hypothetical protein